MKKLIMLITILAFWGCDSEVLEATISEEIISSVEGCTNPSATNYNPAATVDDGSCDI